MPKHNVFLALPDELYAEALSLAQMRHLTLSDLLIKALSESLESQQRMNWPGEQLPYTLDRPSRPH